MPFKSEVYRVLIASPSDLAEERQAASDAVNDWNTPTRGRRVGGSVAQSSMKHTPDHRLTLRPRRRLTGQLLVYRDILIGMFWTKIGTKTGVAESGTVEETDEIGAAGKHALLYFKPSD